MTQTATLTETSPVTALPGNLIPQPEKAELQNNVTNINGNPTFDPEALKRKYEEEREKRLRHNGGLEQYRTIDGEFLRMLKDPYVSEKLAREPINDVCEALVIGGGYGAQLVAVELLKAGINDIRIVEKGGEFGGTWYWNRYPGAQCDIESYVYMPLLDETGYIPTQKYAGGQELLHHSQAIGKRYGLYEKALFQTEVKSMTWREENARWDVKTDRGDVISSRFVIPAAGPLHRPKLPGLPGLGSFQGHSFHTGRWDYDYTGGDVANLQPELTGLKNKRVGVIGTGATAVQIVPHLGKWAKQLYVFQRTPSSIDFRGNKPTDPEWVKNLGEHWQKKRMDNFNIIVNGGAQDEDLVCDGWTDILRRLTVRGAGATKTTDPQRAAEKRQLIDFEKMEDIRHRVDESIQDPKTAESLKPWYNQFCKRPCFHDDYLPTFNRSNVTLVDTQGRGVEAITEKGVVAKGEKFELDCLIFATGFELATGWTQKAGLEIYGRDGQSLTDKWSDGPSTLHGHSTHNFPNCFFVQNTQAALSPNFLHITAFQAEHLSYIIGKCHADNIRTIEARQEAEDTWVETIVDSRQRTRTFRMQCTPGYYNNEGETSRALEKKASYGGGALEFMKMMREWRATDNLEGLEAQTWADSSLKN